MNRTGWSEKDNGLSHSKIVPRKSRLENKSHRVFRIVWCLEGKKARSRLRVATRVISLKTPLFVFLFLVSMLPLASSSAMLPQSGDGDSDGQDLRQVAVTLHLDHVLTRLVSRATARSYFMVNETEERRLEAYFLRQTAARLLQRAERFSRRLEVLKLRAHAKRDHEVYADILTVEHLMRFYGALE